VGHRAGKEVAAPDCEGLGSSLDRRRSRLDLRAEAIRRCDDARVERSLADEDYCYLTTTGRVSGEPREIEVWFGLDGRTLYMLSGGRDRSNWVKNLIREPRVRVRIADRTWEGRARVVDDPDEDARARELLVGKYARRYGGDLANWREGALPIAVDLKP
jgi:deazaflavin-dependent oxidoreductase (nitroreductase family)